MSDAPLQLPFWKRLLFMGIVFAFLFIVLEIGTRVVFAVTGTDIGKYEPQFVTSRSRAPRFIPHPFLPYANRPGDERTIRMQNSWPVEGKEFRDIHIRINSMGFRGEETTYRRPPGVVRVVCLGGSTTFGSISDGFTWPEKLEERLEARDPEADFEVLNLGTDGGVSHHDLINLEFHGIHFDPDLVILYQGANDSRNWGRPDFRPDYSHSMQSLGQLPLSTRLALATPEFVWKSWFFCWMSWELRRWTGVAPSLRQATMKAAPSTRTTDPLEGSWAFLANLRSIRAVAAANGAAFLGATFHVHDANDSLTIRMNDQIRALCARDSIDYVDIAAALPHGDETIDVDTMHFTAKGEELMAGLFEGYIEDHHMLDGAVAMAAREKQEHGGSR